MDWLRIVISVGCLVLWAGCDNSGSDPLVDDVSPLVAIASPIANTVVEGELSVRCEASDENAIARYTLLIDDSEVAESLSACQFRWDSRAVPNGLHTLRVTVTDVAGNVGESIEVAVTISNPPESVSIQSVCVEDAPYIDFQGNPWDADTDPDWSITLRQRLGVVLFDSVNPMVDVAQSSLPICWSSLELDVPSLTIGYALILWEEDDGERTEIGRYEPGLGLRFGDFASNGYPASIVLAAAPDLVFRLELTWVYP